MTDFDYTAEDIFYDTEYKVLEDFEKTGDNCEHDFFQNLQSNEECCTKCGFQKSVSVLPIQYYKKTSYSAQSIKNSINKKGQNFNSAVTERITNMYKKIQESSIYTQSNVKSKSGIVSACLYLIMIDDKTPMITKDIINKTGVTKKDFGESLNLVKKIFPEFKNYTTKAEDFVGVFLNLCDISFIHEEPIKMFIKDLKERNETLRNNSTSYSCCAGAVFVYLTLMNRFECIKFTMNEREFAFLTKMAYVTIIKRVNEAQSCIELKPPQ